MTYAFTLRGAHAIVTGASRGIGRQLARELAGRGARVTLIARSSPALHQLGGELGGQALLADLSRADHLAGLIARAEVDGGPVDLLFNNAALAVVGPLVDCDPGDIGQSFALNCVAPVELCRQVLPGMLARGSGRIANISSLAGVTAFPTLSVYGATKAALVQFSAALQREIRRTPVRLTIVQLGEVAGTDMMEQARQSPTIAAVSRRLARTRALPAVSLEMVARKIVDATVAGRRDQVIPARVAPFHKIREFPSRMNDAILVGID
jgi:short-subunit dehydrogenase